MFLTLKRDDLLRQGVFLIDGKINFDQIESVAEWIRRNEIQHDNYTLLIASSGGDPSPVVWFSAFMRTLPSKIVVHGVATGECGSAAFALLQLCHWRAAVRGTGFFVHRAGLETRVGVHEKHNLGPLIRKLSRTQLIEDELVRMQCRRIGCTIDQWYTWAEEGEVIDGNAILVDEARRLNFIDRVISHLPL